MISLWLLQKYTIIVAKLANSYFSVNLMPIVTGQSSEECCTLYLHSQGFQTF